MTVGQTKASFVTATGIAALTLALTTSHTAEAQPQPTPAPGWPAPAGPQSPPGWTQPGVGLAPPSAGCQSCPVPSYGDPPMLTLSEHRLLMRGEISDAAHAGGAITSFLFGFGLGHAVQGRWGDTGWIFTVGEAASGAVAMISFAAVIGCAANTDEGDRSCNADSSAMLLLGSALAFGALRVWETFDAISAPAEHNRRLRELRLRTGMPVATRVRPFAAPTADGGAMAGVAARF